MRQLDVREIKNVGGGWIANAAGAIAGGFGGLHGYMSGSAFAGQGGSRMGAWSAFGTGALIGAVSPASGFRSVITSYATGTASGAWGGYTQKRGW